MKMIIILALIFILCSTINSQDILWKKNFGLNSADDFGQSDIETNDGNIAIAGYTGSYGVGGFDVWLIKTDADGNVLWSKTYGGLGDDYAYAMKQTDDKGFIIGGATNSFGVGGLDYYVIRTDSSGDTLWTKTIGDIKDDVCYSVEISDDDGFVIVGKKDSYPLDENLWIIKLNINGMIIWDKLYGTANDDDGSSIKKLSNGGYIISGSTNCNILGNANCDGWLLKINEEGDTLWAKTFFGTDDSDWFEEVVETNDGGFILSGRIALPTSGYEGDVWLLKTDSLGNVEWEKTYDYDNDYDIGYSVQQTIDGGYIVSGGGYIYDWISHGWIIRTDSLGDTLWTKYIEGYPDRASPNTTSLNSYFFSIIQMSNGDYVCTGIEAQAPLNDQIWLVRIASDIVPVELTSFTAIVTRNAVSLNWQTATETNNSGFEIERTSPLPSPYEGEGATLGWSVVGFVPGFGTTTEPKSYSFINENVSAGNYQYRLKQIDFDGSFEYSNIVEVSFMKPDAFSLDQNYPNPFNPSTNIQYAISSKQFVTLKIFNSLGEEIETLVNEFQEAGVHSKLYPSGINSTLPSGAYYYQLRAGSFVETKKMILLR